MNVKAISALPPGSPAGRNRPSGALRGRSRQIRTSSRWAPPDGTVTAPRAAARRPVAAGRRRSRSPRSSGRIPAVAGRGGLHLFRTQGREPFHLLRERLLRDLGARGLRLRTTFHIRQLDDGRLQIGDLHLNDPCLISEPFSVNVTYRVSSTM